MMQILLWAMTLLAITGTILNIRKNRLCFFLWGTTNLFWVIWNCHNGELQQAFLFVVHFGLAVWGWFKWKTTA